MTDERYNQLVEFFGKRYADAARRVIHTGSNEALKDYLNIRKDVINGKTS